MAHEKDVKLLRAWKYYLASLWLVAIIFLGVIIYGFIAIQLQARENPAIGLAMVGVVAYTVVLIIYCGFVFLNMYIEKR